MLGNDLVVGLVERNVWNAFELLKESLFLSVAEGKMLKGRNLGHFGWSTLLLDLDWTNIPFLLEGGYFVLIARSNLLLIFQDAIQFLLDADFAGRLLREHFGRFFHLYFIDG